MTMKKGRPTVGVVGSSAESRVEVGLTNRRANAGGENGTAIQHHPEARLDDRINPEFCFPFAGDYRGAEWNAQAFCSKNTHKHLRKKVHALKAMRNHDV